jgi:hypothetical protein
MDAHVMPIGKSNFTNNIFIVLGGARWLTNFE